MRTDRIGQTDVRFRRQGEGDLAAVFVHGFLDDQYVWDGLIAELKTPGADVFIGVSGGTVPETAVATMAKRAFIFAMANPTPEVHPDVARKYAAIVATGRSDYPNQIDNVLAFPGIFAGALRVRASRITPGMKLAAADALASVVIDELRPDHIIPSPFDPRVAPAVAEAVATTARLDGVARR